MRKLKDIVVIFSLIMHLITLISSVMMLSENPDYATYLLILSLWMFSISQSKK